MYQIQANAAAKSAPSSRETRYLSVDSPALAGTLTVWAKPDNPPNAAAAATAGTLTDRGAAESAIARIPVVVSRIPESAQAAGPDPAVKRRIRDRTENKTIYPPVLIRI